MTQSGSSIATIILGLLGVFLGATIFRRGRAALKKERAQLIKLLLKQIAQSKNGAMAHIRPKQAGPSLSMITYTRPDFNCECSEPVNWPVSLVDSPRPVRTISGSIGNVHGELFKSLLRAYPFLCEKEVAKISFALHMSDDDNLSRRLQHGMHYVIRGFDANKNEKFFVDGVLLEQEIVHTDCEQLFLNLFSPQKEPHHG